MRVYAPIEFSSGTVLPPKQAPAVEQTEQLDEIQLSPESERGRVSEPTTGALPCAKRGGSILPARHADEIDTKERFAVAGAKDDIKIH